MEFGPLRVSFSAEVSFFAIDDEVTLESEDRVQLLYFTSSDLFSEFQGRGEYIRDTAIVYIIDNDRE